MSKDERISRLAVLTALLAALMVIAGCSGVLSDSEASSKATESKSASTPVEDDYSGSSETVNATDLRNVTIPNNGSITVSGELDTGDPTNDSTFYEPVRVAVRSGVTVNITMQTESGEPRLRIRNPDGAVTQRTGDDGTGTTELTRGTFTQTGLYTLEATSANANATFEYNLTIERSKDRLFNGPKRIWNETERYLAFGDDFVGAVNATADNGQFASVINKRSLWANATNDYLIIGYQWDAENLTVREMNEIDTAILLTYANSWETYRNATDNPMYAEGKSWVPEVIYFRTENPQGKLYRTNFLTKEWARDYIKTENESVYAGRYYATKRIGPASPSYGDVSDSVTTTQAEFPRETYRQFMHGPTLTHAEKYYDDNSSDE